MNSTVVRIIVPFTVLLLIVVSLLAGIYYVSTRDSLTDAANQILLGAARTTVSNLRNFISGNSTILRLEVEARRSILVTYLETPPDQRVGTDLEGEVRAELINLANQRTILSYALLDRQGQVLIDSSTSPVQTNSLPPGFDLGITQPDYLDRVISRGLPYVSPVIFSSIFEQPMIIYITRVTDEEGIPLGMVFAIHKASTLQEEIFLNNGLAGTDSFAVLVDENLLRLGHGADPTALYTFIVPPEEGFLQQLLETRRINSQVSSQTIPMFPGLRDQLASITPQQPFFTTEDIAQEEVLYSAVAISMPEANWTLLFMQPQSVVLAPVIQQTQNTLLFAVAVSLLGIFVSILLGQALTRPILYLTQVAEKVAMGDINVRANIKTGLFAAPNEMGTLALAFNVMNTRQKLARDELEARVDARTSDLAKISEQMRERAVQLQAVAEVARAITSEQDLERLLPLITHTISDRFGFYHVGIFLLDELQEYAVLRAANSAGGMRMLARNHKLRVGQVGIIGFVTAQGQPRLALDVGKDAFFFDNPDLPLTRSEIGIPLKVREQVIGALDAQSTQPSAFTQDDVEVLTTLADQVAIAIDNARLFGETRRTLSELQVTQRDYIKEEWTNLTTTQTQLGFRYEKGALSPLTSETKHLESDLWNSLESQGFVVQHGADIDSSHPEQGSSNLLVPIRLRGIVIGVIDLRESDPDRDWSEEEISLVSAVAEQVGLALENARLMEETRRRADREHLVSSITTRLRESNDPQVILQTAAAELRQALRARTAQVIVQPKEGKEA